MSQLLADAPPRLRKADWVVQSVGLAQCQWLVSTQHYAKGGANTATFRHGLFRREDDLWETACVGVAWWIPPTKGAAQATWDGDWRRVLALSRLVIAPGIPKNAASFLLGASTRLIRRDGQWDCLVTYADEWQGHSGGIYRAANWEYLGRTPPEAIWVDAGGRMIARKAGPVTRTKAEMEALGYVCLGRHARHKFRLVLRRG